MTHEQDRGRTCPRCKADWRPMILLDVDVKPCGLMKDDIRMGYDIKIAGCPMHEKQEGYLQALRDAVARLEGESSNNGKTTS